jgi:addiction module RelE/StbE family toxin
MVELRWTEQALDDINSIAKFIAKDSMFYAKLVIRNIFKSTEKITQFPEIGRIVPELQNENIREVISGSYRIIYRIQNKLLQIITVYHSSRLFSINLKDL